jgi:FkbM family methyltransferase
MKGNYFTIGENENNYTKRLKRLRNLTRIPFHLFLRLAVLYTKKLFGYPGTAKENADNYYFLTLINCDAYSVSINKNYYEFKKRDGTKFLARKNPSSDLEVFNQVWGRDEYDKAASLVSSKGRDNMVIIDAGANVGYTTLFFHHLFPDARIISIEPDDENLHMFDENIKLNRAGNIISVKAGLWSHRCNLLVDKNFRDNREWSFRVKEVDQKTGLTGMHISDIMSDFGLEEIDLLKIDIEGAEKQLFEDKVRTKEVLAKTKIIAMEIHDEEVSRDELYSILDENRFSHFDYSDLTIGKNEG